MKNKKVLIIIPIILIILLLVCIASFAFIYFATDMFKSPKQLFFKYVGKTFETSEEFDYDKFLENYKSQSEKSYKSSGEMNIEINSDSSDLKQVKEVLDKSKITYTINSIPTQSKGYANIGITYNNNEITKFEGLTSNDNYGLKCADLYDKYIYIENNNLKSLARKLGIQTTSIPDKFKKVDYYDLLYISKDTRTKIKDTYYKVLNENLNKKMFTSEKNIETNVNGEIVKTNTYSLTLNDIESYNILISLLETLKNDDTTLDLIIDKLDKSNIKDNFEQGINGYYSYDTISDDEKITFDKNYLKNSIQDLIDDLQDEKSDVSSDNTMKITVYVSNGKTVKIEFFANNESKMNFDITKNKNANNILSVCIEGVTILKADYTVSKEKNSQESNGTITIITEDTTLPIDFNIKTGKELNTVNIKATIPIEDIIETSQTYIVEDIVIETNMQTTGKPGTGTNSSTSFISLSSGDNSIKLNMKEDIIYTEDISIDDLNTDNGECLNNMSVSEIETLMKEIVTNFQKVLPSKLELLGIDSSTLNVTNNTTADEDLDNLNDTELTDPNITI